MFHTFSNFVRSLFTSAPVTPYEGVANSLMEKAESCAGRNPWQANQLRLAACAYLSVVR
ncbi:MAG: hypothetical protein ABIR13_03310 [Polaromonas sp.]